MIDKKELFCDGCGRNITKSLPEIMDPDVWYDFCDKCNKDYNENKLIGILFKEEPK